MLLGTPGEYEASQIGSVVTAAAGAGPLGVRTVMDFDARRRGRLERADAGFWAVSSSRPASQEFMAVSSLRLAALNEPWKTGRIPIQFKASDNAGGSTPEGGKHVAAQEFSRCVRRGALRLRLAPRRRLLPRTSSLRSTRTIRPARPTASRWRRASSRSRRRHHRHHLRRRRRHLGARRHGERRSATARLSPAGDRRHRRRARTSRSSVSARARSPTSW